MLPEKLEYSLQDFNGMLFEALRDPEAAAIYLQDAWEDSTDEFLIALRKYVQANGILPSANF
ncbi:MAG: hypothetical protein ACRYFS_14570 [Janthinobacterium lividum]